jgi:4-amino-4-deoxy-L-arabinose transferase-like glycosyltransferase
VEPVEPETRARTAGLALAALLALAAVYGFVLVRHASRSVGGSDSAGYFNSARSLAAGRFVEPVDALARLGFPPDDVRLFMPLGYVPGPRPGTMASFYPPGLPLHVAAAGALAGWSEAPFWISPLCAVAAVLLTYGVGRELGLAPLGSLAAAAMLACLPVLNFQAMQLMSDTAALAWALAAMYLALRARRGAPSWQWRSLAAGAGAGVAFGIGVLVRPASAVLLLPLAFAMPRRRRAWLCFLAGGTPCAAFFILYNRACYGGALSTGYGAGGALVDFALANFPLRFRLYPYWLASQMTAVVPIAGALALLDRRRPLSSRLLLLAWFGSFFACYCFYGPADAWWYTRYLLPGIPAVYLAAAMGAEDALAWLRSRLRLAKTRAAAIVLVLLLALLVCWRGLDTGRRYRLLRFAQGEAVYPEAVRWLSGRVPAEAVVVVMQLSGAMRAYDGRTFLRWDFVEADRFPGIRRRIEERGVPIYALVFPFEVNDAAARMPGRWKYLESYRDASLFRLEP